MQTNAGRTSNGVPKHARLFADDPVLEVSGAVANGLRISSEDLLAFPRIASRTFFTPEERSLTPDYDLSGVLVVTILEHAGLLPEAVWISFCAGPYNHPIRIEEVRRVMLCDELDGAVIPVERGGPYRTLIPGHGYNMSVKWVDRVVVSIEKPDDSATRLAEARERARQFKRNQSGAKP